MVCDLYHDKTVKHKPFILQNQTLQLTKSTVPYVTIEASSLVIEEKKNFQIFDKNVCDPETYILN